MYKGKILCAPRVSQSPEEVRASTVFNNWSRRAEDAGITIKSVYVAAAFQWGDVPEPRMLMLEVDAYYGDRKLDRCVFLRGNTTCVVATLLCQGVRYGVVTSQVRLAGAHADVIDWPSGMVEAADVDFQSAGLRELLEETGTEGRVKWVFKANVSQAFTGSPDPMGVSEGGTDEAATFFWAEAEVNMETLTALKGATAGARDENERIIVVIEPWQNIPSVLGRSGRACLKAVTGWLLVNDYITYG